MAVSKKSPTVTFYGIDNFLLFIEAGCERVYLEESRGNLHFQMFIVKWPEKGKPKYPVGVSNPLRDALDRIDKMIEELAPTAYPSQTKDQAKKMKP